MTQDRGRRVLRWVGLALLWIVLFAYFSYLLFPYESLRARVENGIRAAVPTLSVSFEGLGPSGTGGLDLQGVRVIDMPISPDAPILVADRLTIRPVVLPLILGRRGAAFHANAYGGSVGGELVTGKETTRVLVGIDGMDLSAYQFLTTTLGRTVKGKLDAKADLKLDGDKLSRADGVLTLAIAEGEFQPFVSKAEKGPPPMRIRVKRLKGRFEIEKGKATVKPFTFDGPDIEGNAEGSITLADRLDLSRVDGELRFRFVSEEMKNTVGPLLEALGNKKNADGYYQIKLRGTLAHPV